MPERQDSLPPPMATDALPAAIVIPPRLVVSRESFEEVLAQVENPGEPTEAMRALFRRRS